jgi:hypothetical protein
VIAHAGRSAVTLFRFGELAMNHTKTRMEEAAFDVPGLSADCFIPPADIRRSADVVPVLQTILSTPSYSLSGYL